MSAGRLPVRTILGAAFTLGLLGDYLLRASGGPGLNFLLLFIGLAAAVWLAAKRADLTISTEGAVWVGLALLFATGLVWRGSAALQALSLLGAATAFSIPALHAGGAWVRRTGLTDLLEAVAGSSLHAALGSVRVLSAATLGGSTGSPPSRAWSLARTALGGILFAALPLAVFGALFLSADAIFAQIVGDLVRIDLDALVSHVISVGLLSWLACGYLSGFVTGTRLEQVRSLDLPRPRLGISEVGTALALIDLLFLGFVWVQFRYLFGGADLVEVTPGLTYAEYAREGFFQLVLAAALVLPWLLFSDWILGGSTRRDTRIFNGLGGVQLLLLLGIVASAFQRMGAYQAAYGLTEARFFATAFLIWLVSVLLWFAATVLRGRRELFTSGTLVSAFALVAALLIANPDAFIARTNLGRVPESPSGASFVGSTQATSVPVDLEYLSSLGSDAVPVLLAGLGDLPEDSRCRIAGRLLRSWGPNTRSDWRNWNWSVSRARAAVREEAAALRRLAPESGECA